MGSPLFESVAEAQRQRFDLLEPDARRIASARLGNTPREDPVRDRNRRGEERACADCGLRADLRLDFSR